MTRVAIFFDDDVGAHADGGTSVAAAVRHAPDGINARIYPVEAWPARTRLQTLVRIQKADVVHLATSGPAGLAGRIVAQRLQLPVTGDYGSARLPLERRRVNGRSIAERYRRWLFAPCRPLLVLSHAALDALLLAGYRADELRVCPQGVDVDRFSPGRRLDRLRWMWHVDDRRPAIACVGRLTRENGMHLLPHIQRELGAWGTSHRFVIIGDGPMEAELRARCPDAVFFGLQPEDEVASTLASSDVLLFAGSVELPVCAVIQAQACGIPVVVADAGGAHEEMRPGLSGLIARGSTPAEFADAIRRLVRDRDLVAPDERSSARVRVDATLAGCRQTTCHRIAGRGPTARRLGIAAFGPVDQDTVTPAATLDARPYRVAPSAPSSFVFDPVTATSSGVDTLARMVERLMSVTCPRCCRSGILVMGATFAGPREQRWRCRWCGQPNRARVDAVIVRAFKRANTPSGQLLITEPWRRGYLREPLARDVQGSA